MPTILPPEGETFEAPIPRNDTGRNEGALGYNPRCLTRDINLGWSNSTKRLDVEYLMQCSNIECLERRVDGWEGPRTNTENGRYNRLGMPQVHPAGHFSIGGLQNDPFASPGDPVFFLLHAMVDRIYTIWQAQNPSVRLNEVGGTRTPFNSELLPFNNFFSPSFPLSFLSLSPSISLSGRSMTLQECTANKSSLLSLS